MNTQDTNKPNNEINAANAACIVAQNDLLVFDGEDILQALNILEAHLDAKYKNHDEWVNSHKDLVSSSADAESFAVDGYYCYGASLPDVLRASVFVYAYGRLEYSLHTLCKLLQAVNGVRCGPEDLKDRGFVRSRKYLEKVVGVTWTKAERDVLKDIAVYGSLRNAIIHRNSILMPDEIKDMQAFFKDNGIELQDDRVLRLNAGSVFAAVQHMQKTWDLVYQRCADLADRDSAGSAARSINPP